ncbi:MAG: mechanosensitive ion channel [Alphaproteobacteria bacterium]|nr:mechanosensitive ion channel [Alphaproteobacteria bacterium]MBT7944394.1 mechanosensitive ion channel [Alphaproteobacteria bacterium]
MEQFLDPAFIEARIAEVTAWVHANIFVLSFVIQFFVIALAFVIARLGEARFHQLLDKGWDAPWYDRFARPVTEALAPLSLPVIWLALQWFSVVAAENAGWPIHPIRIVVSLLTAWIIIRLGSTLIRNAAWSRAIAVAAWSIAALNITGLLDPTTAVLDSMALNIGDVRISILGVVKAIIALSVLLWMAGYLSRLLERRLNSMPGVTPAAGVLFGKLFRVLLFTFAIVVAMDSVGIDLTALALFSGAIGLGIGFGLQKVFSNLISGVILVMDRSVKPGDVIAIGETYGWINALSARYVSVITRDGTEHLIPNEELISQRVENWSFSNRLVRLRLAVGVAYDTDVKKAMAVAIEAAAGVDRVLSEPAPACLLNGFGDNAVNLELRVWINDPRNGLGNVKSAILLSVWEQFADNAIAFPYPQRDLHIKSAVPLRVENAPSSGQAG